MILSEILRREKIGLYQEARGMKEVERKKPGKEANEKLSRPAGNSVLLLAELLLLLLLLMPLLFGEVAIDGEQPLIEFAFESGLIDPGPDDDDDEDEYGSSNIEMV